MLGQIFAQKPFNASHSKSKVLHITLRCQIDTALLDTVVDMQYHTIWIEIILSFNVSQLGADSDI